MDYSVPATDTASPSRCGVSRALAQCVALALFSVMSAAPAQAPLARPALTGAEIRHLPLVGTHVAALRADDPPDVTILVPRPAVPDSSDYLALVLDDCLELTGLTDAGLDGALEMGARLVGAQRCATTIVVSFVYGAERFNAAVAVVVSRVAAPSPPPGLAHTVSVDLVSLPLELAGPDPFASPSILHVRLTNLGNESARIDSLVEERALSELVAWVFTPREGGFDGSWRSLAEGSEAFVPAELAPGSAAEYVIVLAPPGKLTSGSWAATVRPAFEVVYGGENYALVTEKVSVVRSPEQR